MFIVIEIQVNDNNEVSTIVTNYATRNEADNQYHTILAYAAISAVKVHTAMIVTADGQLVASDRYIHIQEQPVEEEQEEQ